MAFIGNTNTTQAFTPAVDFFNGDGSTVAFTLSRPVASTAQVQATIANVPQNPGSAFTVLGSTITFTSAPPSGTNNIYVYYTSPISTVATISQAPSIIGPELVSINNAAALSGATNPIVAMAGSANNYVQSYVRNATDAANASADFTAYPSNGSDSSGWVDVGVTGPTYSQAAYSVTGPNEAYLFGSAPSGASKTGNLVIATDSTGTSNAIQFYAGGFNQSKSAVKFTVDSTGAYGQLKQGTAQASTSGTSIDFTGIPSWAKRITVMFNGVSTNGTNVKYVQIGSGSVVTSGYGSAATRCGSTGLVTANYTGGFTIASIGAGDTISGSFVLYNVSGNIWEATGIFADESSTSTYISAGRLTLSNTLDRVRITTAGGTDTFDAGSINILYE